MRFVAIAALAILAGCTTYNADGMKALERGDTAEAERQFNEGAQRKDPVSINYLGVIYEKRGERARAVQYYTLAARYGVRDAQENLKRLGEPVPAADIAAAEAKRQAEEAERIRGSQQLHCKPVRVGNTVTMECQ